MRLWDEPLSEEDKDRITELLASKVERWGLTVPAILWLEMHKPIARVAANAAIVVSPFIVPFSGMMAFDNYTQFFEDRENIERLIRRLEQGAAGQRGTEKDTANATR